MKKRIIIALFAAFGISQMNAQATFSPGLRAGVNFANITETDGKYKTDFYVGALMEMNLTKRYTLQPELSYTRQGAADVNVSYYDENNIQYTGKQSKLDINYLSITLMNRFNIVEGFHVLVGSFSRYCAFG
ncbi:outer membrane beta-barrel protein [Flavobacterium sp. 3HN19-14]|uniref:outer membrane beta-barrel protein n=1 Tax=Flavobacterium sp. 3HN19-14 TaxID=3448133 RepID=UPI003EDE7CF5